ncbi:MAG: hypothetical protein UHM16_03050 [Acutalibacteraceae bacterium]|nr:hypothetical protein [Acutalibacteraceae bacterium]
MQNAKDTVILFVLLLLIIILIAVIISHFLTHYNQNVRFLKMEIRRAGDYDEFCYWRKQLRCYYLSLIPFITDRNVEFLYRIFFPRRSKHEKEKKNKDSVFRLLAPSIIGGCICAVMLCGASWAWFTASTVTTTQTIKTPDRYIISQITVNGTLKDADSDGSFKLSENTRYEISLSPETDSTEGATGYCAVAFNGGMTYYTEQISAGSTYTFTVESDNKVTITPKWGTCAVRKEENTVGNGTSVGTQTQNTTQPQTSAEAGENTAAESEQQTNNASSESEKTQTSSSDTPSNESDLPENSVTENQGQTESEE